jgi:hypothetical protein
LYNNKKYNNANLNKCKKHPWLKLAAGTLTENSDSELVMHRRQLVKGRCNPSAYKPILISDSSIREITIDNSKSPQSITELKSTNQPNNIIDNPTAALLTVNTL